MSNNRVSAGSRLQTTDDTGMLLRANNKGWQSTIWTAIPGIVESVNLEENTVEVQPTIQGWFQDETLTFDWHTMPLLLDVPIMWQKAGGFSITMPVQKGDECLVIFASRCIDSWWNSGGIAVQAELRMHDLSDGFAFIGPSSLPNVIADVSATDVEIRNAAGTQKIALQPSGDINITTTGNINAQCQDANVTAIDQITLTAPIVGVHGTLEVLGNVIATGTINAVGEIEGMGIKLAEHQHTGVTNGDHVTGGPVNIGP